MTTYAHSFAYRPDDPAWKAAWPDLCRDVTRLVEYTRECHGVRCSGFLLGEDAHVNDDMIMILPHTDIRGAALDLMSPASVAAQIREGRMQPGQVVQAALPTLRLPYDVVVAAALLRAAQLARPSFVFRSDGAWDGEWERGAVAGGPSARGLVRALFGTDVLPPLAERYFRGERLTRDALASPPPPLVPAAPLVDVLFGAPAHTSA